MEQHTIGPFRLEEELGKGGMGIVYRAIYTKTGQQVALKVLPEAMSSNEKLVARFEREMSILKKLKHRHIVPYYGGWKYKGQHFYAM
ncbi:MAG TPA: serine/threonine protein kinase, partial [Planctomycetaceae bacterium]|nr:serine/threonine protein kinase [Planctomycetaceae bacterium]